MTSTLKPVAQARQIVLEATVRLDPEAVEIGAGLNRVLATEVRANGDVPPFPCSAMDGFAIHRGPASRHLIVIGEARAGSPFDGEVQDGQAVRISTGAAIPTGATAVIRQEDVALDGQIMEPLTETVDGQNVRDRGEDMREGATILQAGTILGAAELGAAVAAGAGSLQVSRQPRVAVLCTGDELRAPGEPLGPGEIHNSNSPMLAALATRCGAVVAIEDRLPDDREKTKAALATALERCDAVVVCGGVSVGPHDHVKPALAALGVREHFWGVALQPGKPTWFGTQGTTLVFGLPGNPVSAAVTFSLFARPALLTLQGAPADNSSRQARLATSVARNPIREQALRVRLEQRDHEVTAVPNGRQGSNIVSSLLGADALAMIPTGEGEIEAGTWVQLAELPG